MARQPRYDSRPTPPTGITLLASVPLASLLLASCGSPGPVAVDGKGASTTVEVRPPGSDAVIVVGPTGRTTISIDGSAPIDVSKQVAESTGK